MKKPYQILNDINTSYHLQTSSDALNNSLDTLTKLIDSKILIDSNIDSAKALSIRLFAKLLLTRYSESNFNKAIVTQWQSQYQSLKEGSASYAKTLVVVENTNRCFAIVDDIVSKAKHSCYTVVDNQGQRATNDLSMCDNAIDTINKLISDTVNNTDSIDKIFGDKVIFNSLSQSIVAYLNGQVSKVNKARQSLEGQLYQQAFDDCTTVVDTQKYIKYTYDAVIFNTEDISKIHIVCSPIEQEVMMLMSAYCNKSSLSLVKLNVSALAKCNKDIIAYVGQELGRQNAVVLVSNYHYTEDKQTKALLQLAGNLPDNKLYVHDKTSDRQCYIALSQDDALSISYHYLSMPNYSNVIAIFEEIGLLDKDDDSDDTFVRENCQFMGFVGFNEAIISYVSGFNWQKTARQYSDDNRVLCMAYLKNIPSQSQLIDSGWGELKVDNNQQQQRKPFSYDYDKPHQLNMENVKRILEDSRFSLLQKGGLIVKYCLTCGNDVSEWKTLDKDQLQDRMEMGCVLLARLLDNEYVPAVSVLERLSNEFAGGLCRNGGKLLEFKLSSIKSSLDYAIDALCHETFHAFQYTVMHNGWRQWHLDELHILPKRVEEWISNNSCYIDLKSNSGEDFAAYRYQIFESDTNIVASTMKQYADTCWHQLQLD